ncbi:hypothetical protein WDU94_004118 [Cyamophila willieti]
MKAKHRAMVSIKDLASSLKAFKNKSELNQLTSSVNHLIKMGLVDLVLPECANKSLKQVGLGGKLMDISSYSPSPSSHPRLSPGIVFSGNTGSGLSLNKLGSCGPCKVPCGDCCCRPRLSVGVVYPENNVGLNQQLRKSVEMNQLCGGSCGSCNCRPRLSVGVVYPN